MTNQNQSVAIIQKDITDSVNTNLARLQEDGLTLPPNYNASNALKSAFFKLQETKDRKGALALDVCSRESVANSLLDMVVQGLSPAKTQCYFIVYGTQLQLSRSYFGTQVVLKRLSNVNDIWANVIFKGDDFVYENERGRDKFLSHGTKFENRDNEIIGAYTIIEKADKELELTVMTKKEIEASWSQSKTGQAVHKKFPQEMAKRTVINRAAKAFINTSDDSDLLIESIRKTTENEYENDNERKEINPQREIEEKANSEFIDVTSNEGEIKPEPPFPEPEKEAVEEPKNADSDTSEIISDFEATQGKAPVAEVPNW